jgi:hypothetical protein
MLMTNKELTTLNLTEARADMLLKAALRDNGQVRMWGTQARTMKALTVDGYIARVLAHTPEEIQELTYTRDEHVKTAKTALTHDDWTLALSALKQAEKLDEEMKRLETRLTVKGWQFVNDYRKRQDEVGV